MAGIGLFSMACRQNVITPGNQLSSRVENYPKEALSTFEESSLIHMREEEKLARDVYKVLYSTWMINIFNNIAQSEQTHTDAVAVLLDRYELSDPVGNDQPGVFVNESLQNLYNSLVETGSQSIENALTVGATIEDLDLFDLEEALKSVDNQDITFVYENLSKGSRNHMRSFYDRLGSYGQDYSPQYISSDYFLEIITTNKETGAW